jgi:serine/threonine-protein kinase RsbW
MRVASRLEELPQVIERVLAPLLERGELASADATWLRLCLDEALTNAMLHGNEGDPDLDLDITVALTTQRYLITISDRGTGFGANAVPVAQAAPTSECGRGIRLLQEYLDQVVWYQGGSVVVLGQRRAQDRHSLVPPLST